MRVEKIFEIDCAFFCAEFGDIKFQRGVNFGVTGAFEATVFVNFGPGA